MIGLDQAMTVLTRGAGGAYTVTATSGVACRVCHINQAPAPTTADRAALAQARRLLWAESYVMPDEARVTVDGTTWQVVPGTIGHFKGPMSYRACELRRV